MPSRRISAPDVLAPHQEIAVNAYSSYNSDNVNMLTRIVTGEKDHDFVINGLDVSGLNRIQDEILGDIIVNDSFNYADLAALNTNWITEYMDMGIGGVNKAVTKLTLNTKFARCKLKSKTTIDTEYIGDKFKIEFTIQNTPKQLHVCIGSETFSYRYPNPGSYTLYMDLISENGIFENLTFLIDIDTLDQYCDQQVYIDDITLTQVVNKGDNIAPITDPTVDPLDIPERLLHPHETAEITAGVCVKDETMINMIGTKGSDLSRPVSTLIYGNNDSWIKGEAFQDSDFTGQSSFWDPSGTNIPVAYANGELENDSLDDGETNGPRKIDGDASVANIKWAYVCIYYSYFKHPNPNKAYLGLAKPEELENARYGEDYLILAKLRFIDKNTVDAIFYYPERKDWGFIDATRVNYLHLTTLKHWLDRPINVSLALDQLASSIYHIKGCLYFQTQRQFTQWRNRELPTGVGHGPYDYMQRRSGSDPDNSYDLLAYVIETNTFWKSKLQSTQEINSIEVTDQGDNYTHATVIIDGGVGSGAKLKANVSGGSIVSIDVLAPGSNYVVAPTIVITGGSNATATAYITEGKVSNIVVNNGGSGYDQNTIQVTASSQNQIATATAVINDSKITEITVDSGGKYLSDLAPQILISGDGSGAKATAKMNIVTDGYDPIIIWEELSTKRFEVDWSKENNGSWPDTKPDNWIWYNGETTVESSDYKTFEEAQTEWPLSYYRIKAASDPDSSYQTVVNPYNIKGRGLVPGPTGSEVYGEKFLRSDGSWKKTMPVGSIVMYAGPVPTDLFDEVEDGGWLLCLGQVYDLNDYPQYAALATALSTHQEYFREEITLSGTQFRIPDLSDRFVIGYDPSNSDRNGAGAQQSDPLFDQPDMIGKLGGTNKLRLRADQLPAHSHKARLIGSALSDNEDETHTHLYQDTFYTYTPHTRIVSTYTSNVSVISSLSEHANVLAKTTGEENSPHKHLVKLDDQTIIVEEFGGNEEIDSRPKFITLGFIIKV